MKEDLHGDYAEINKILRNSLVAMYVANYLRSGQLYEYEAQVAMDYTIPLVETVEAAILNPIAELALPNILRQHRNDTIRRTRIAIAESIRAGESYSVMAERIKKEVGFSKSKAQTVARTEGGRVQTLSRLDSAAKAQKALGLDKKVDKGAEERAKPDEPKRDQLVDDRIAPKEKEPKEEQKEFESPKELDKPKEPKKPQKDKEPEVPEQTEEEIGMGKVWMSALDKRVRRSHRRIDNQSADKNGYFHYGGNKAQGPRLFVGPDSARLNINCRCTVIFTVNGKRPRMRRGRNYEDAEYQKRLAKRMDKLMADEGLTEREAEKKAEREIKPPSLVIPYQSYREWYSKLPKQEKRFQ